VRLSASYKTPRGWSATANVGYYTNKSDSGEYSVRKIDTKTFFVTPGVRYQFSEDIALDASYDYTLYKEDESDAATRAHRHLFLIRLYIQHALLSK
jgi:long-subunit fatty acid transport protein